MGDRYDSLDKHYKSVEIFENITIILYWALFILSLSIVYMKDMNSVFSCFFIVLTIAYFVCNNYLKIYLIPDVENKRRAHLLSNSFGVCLDHEETSGYYNNCINPSILKLGANVFENSLFVKTVVSKMLIIERSKIAVYFLLFISLILYRNIDLSAMATVAQTLFSGEIISKWLYMEFLKRENIRIFDNMHTLFLSYTTNKSDEFNAQIIDNFVKYESAKAYCGIKQSSKIFFKINSETTKKWEVIKKKLRIDEAETV